MLCPRTTIRGSTGTTTTRARMSVRPSSTVGFKGDPSTPSGRTPRGWRWSSTVRTSGMSKLFTRASLARRSNEPGHSTPSPGSAARMSSGRSASRYWILPRAWRICSRSTRWSRREECRLPSTGFSTRRLRRGTRGQRPLSRRDCLIPRKPPWQSVTAMVFQEPSCRPVEPRTTSSTFAIGDCPRATKPPSTRIILRSFSGESARCFLFRPPGVVVCLPS
mmetsp:Transcript_35675/g.85872  ORF Transcript_35675/g.85872 Transcript_35675/m.85872 type:complete len:220 (+) Transcript_35675:295-954(+)